MDVHDDVTVTTLSNRLVARFLWDIAYDCEDCQRAMAENPGAIPQSNQLDRPTHAVFKEVLGLDYTHVETFRQSIDDIITHYDTSPATMKPRMILQLSKDMAALFQEVGYPLEQSAANAIMAHEIKTLNKEKAPALG